MTTPNYTELAADYAAFLQSAGHFQDALEIAEYHSAGLDPEAMRDWFAESNWTSSVKDFVQLYREYAEISAECQGR